MWLTFILLLDGTTLKSFLHTAIRAILLKCQNFPFLRSESAKGFPAPFLQGGVGGGQAIPWIYSPACFFSLSFCASPVQCVSRSAGLLWPLPQPPPRVCLWTGIPSLRTLFPRWFQDSFLISVWGLHEHPLSTVRIQERGPSWPPCLNQHPAYLHMLGVGWLHSEWLPIVCRMKATLFSISRCPVIVGLFSNSPTHLSLFHFAAHMSCVLNHLEET